jgi:hypothetical protein
MSADHVVHRPGSKAELSRRDFLNRAFASAGAVAFADMAATACSGDATRTTTTVANNAPSGTTGTTTAVASQAPLAGGPGPGGGSGTLTDFVGVTTDGTVVDGLYAIKSTGVTTSPVRNAAAAYLAGLSAEQRTVSVFPLPPASAATDEFRLWSNVDGYTRQGVRLADLTDPQKTLAEGILQTGLSADGLEMSQTIRKLNTTAGQLINRNSQFNELLYYFTFLGEPSETGPWGWQFEGHHLVINYFVLGDQVVMTPSFYGSEPRVAPAGKSYAGLAVFDKELAAGIAMINALDGTQQATAIVQADKTGDDNVAEAFGDNTQVPYQGINVSTLTPAQQTQLFALVAMFVHEDDGHAAIHMDEIRAHLADTYFSWVGGTGADSVFYFRVQSPVVLLQFDCQGPGPIGQGSGVSGVTRNHIHSIIRTPNGNDYGKDLLALHLALDH